jgi:sterol desaturase/sphingolipid hydroxylase (fatty acid hydroxylase superfamily)
MLICSMVHFKWMNYRYWALLMRMLPVPVLIIAEHIWTKRPDWILKPDEMVEDAFWLAMGGLLWGPLISDWYSTPISESFKAVRNLAPLDITLEPTTFWGIMGCVMVLRISTSFIYYWLHRVSHESLFFWRTHATHHHINKMGCMRGDRTHPTEYLALNLSTPIILALAGASNEVIAVSAAFGAWNGKLNHSNLPLTSMPVYDWVFATAQQHHVHHAAVLRQANTNYGCQLILWDRIFGTYCGDTEVGRIGAGRKAKRLTIKEQFMIAFYSNKK